MAVVMNACGGNQPIPEPVEPEPVVIEEPIEPPVETTYYEPEPIEPVIEEPIMEESMMVEETPAYTEGDITSVPVDYYTLQLVAASSMQNLSDFALQQGLSETWTTQTVVDGKSWYILMLGVYPTLDEAKEAKATVQDLLNTNPWIRTVGSVHDVMIQ